MFLLLQMLTINGNARKKQLALLCHHRYSVEGQVRVELKIVIDCLLRRQLIREVRVESTLLTHSRRAVKGEEKEFYVPVHEWQSW